MFEFIKKIFTSISNLALLTVEFLLQSSLISSKITILFLIVKYTLLYFSLYAAPAWLYYLATSTAIAASGYILMQNKGPLEAHIEDNNPQTQIPLFGIITGIFLDMHNTFTSLANNLKIIGKEDYANKFKKIWALTLKIFSIVAISVSIGCSLYLLHLYLLPSLQATMVSINPLIKLFTAYFVTLAICNFSYKAVTTIQKPLSVGALFLANAIAAALYYSHMIQASHLILLTGAIPSIVAVSYLTVELIAHNFTKKNNNHKTVEKALKLDNKEPQHFSPIPETPINKHSSDDKGNPDLSEIKKQLFSEEKNELIGEGENEKGTASNSRTPTISTNTLERSYMQGSPSTAPDSEEDQVSNRSGSLENKEIRPHIEVKTEQASNSQEPQSFSPITETPINTHLLDDKGNPDLSEIKKQLFSEEKNELIGEGENEKGTASNSRTPTISTNTLERSYTQDSSKTVSDIKEDQVSNRSGSLENKEIKPHTEGKTEQVFNSRKPQNFSPIPETPINTNSLGYEGNPDLSEITKKLFSEEKNELIGEGENEKDTVSNSLTPTISINTLEPSTAPDSEEDQASNQSSHSKSLEKEERHAEIVTRTKVSNGESYTEYYKKVKEASENMRNTNSLHITEAQSHLAKEAIIFLKTLENNDLRPGATSYKIQAEELIIKINTHLEKSNEHLETSSDTESSSDDESDLLEDFFLNNLLDEIKSVKEQLEQDESAIQDKEDSHTPQTPVKKENLHPFWSPIRTFVASKKKGETTNSDNQSYIPYYEIEYKAKIKEIENEFNEKIKSLENQSDIDKETKKKELNEQLAKEILELEKEAMVKAQVIESDVEKQIDGKEIDEQLEPYEAGNRKLNELTIQLKNDIESKKRELQTKLEDLEPEYMANIAESRKTEGNLISSPPPESVTIRKPPRPGTSQKTKERVPLQDQSTNSFINK